MVNRGRVGQVFARGRALVILALLLLGGALLLKRDIASPARPKIFPRRL
jgi:hypothetical protein